MPRKFKTPDSVAQNRENQRRSRARRRELIDDLSHQLNEYKRRGVEATLEVQNAARNVSAENRRLRALLNLHGISESEISRYLSSPDSSTGGISKTRAGNGMRTRRENSHSSLQPAQSKTLMPTVVDSTLLKSQDSPSSVTTRSMSMGAGGGRTSEITPEAILLIPTGSPSSGEGIANTVERHCRSNKEDYCQRCGDEDDQRFKQTEYFENETTSDIFPPVSDCFCPPGPSTISASHTEALETSCDTAAAILIELHSQADAARARIALGCKDISSCSVKNTTIFRLMEELGGEQFDL